MILQRTDLGYDGAPTLGHLSSGSGFYCKTMERSVNGEHPCVAPGTFTVVKDWHHPRDLAKRYYCPELRDVPGRDQIQIHIANRLEQLLGCIAVGEHFSPDCDEIWQSAFAFKRLMTFIGEGGFPFSLTIQNPNNEAAVVDPKKLMGQTDLLGGNKV
jgi:hypothetical protein